jgi:WD40 repeat protein
MTPFTLRVAFATVLASACVLSAQPPAASVSPPSAEEIKAATDTLKDVYDKDYVAAEKDAKLQTALAKKLFDLAPQRKTAAMVFACYDEARRLAASAGNVKLAIAALNALEQDRRFKVAPSLRFATLSTLGKSELAHADARALAELTRDEAVIALNAEDYKTAADFASIAATAAKAADNPDFALDVREFRTHIEALREASYTLKTKPDDPDANTVLGTYWAFDRGNWSVGLKHLTKCSDKALASAASMDLSAPKTAKERTALADVWYKLSRTFQGERKQLLAQRAWEWYTDAVAVATGDDDLKPSERVKELEKEFPTLFATQFEGHTLAVAGLVATPDGKTLISVGNDNSVRIWDAATGKLRKTLGGEGEGWIGFVILSPDGTKAYTSGGESVIRIWDVATLRPAGTLEGHTGAVRGLALSADGKFLVSGGSDKTLRLWDLSTGKSVRIGSETHSVESVAITPDGSRILAGADNGVITVYDAKSGDVVSRFDRHGGTMVYTIAVTKDGKTAISGARDKVIRVWEVATGKELRILTGHTEQVYQVSLSPDEKQVLSGSFDKTVRIWDFATGKELKKYEGHSDGVQGVCFGADGRTVFSASWDKTIRKWRVPPGLVGRGEKKVE